MLKKIRTDKQELFKALEIYFRVTFLHEDAAALLQEEDE